jgi:hypothetical protein
MVCHAEIFAGLQFLPRGTAVADVLDHGVGMFVLLPRRKL